MGWLRRQHPSQDPRTSPPAFWAHGRGGCNATTGLLRRLVNRVVSNTLPSLAARMARSGTWCLVVAACMLGGVPPAQLTDQTPGRGAGERAREELVSLPVWLSGFNFLLRHGLAIGCRYGLTLCSTRRPVRRGMASAHTPSTSTRSTPLSCSTSPAPCRRCVLPSLSTTQLALASVYHCQCTPLPLRSMY